MLIVKTADQAKISDLMEIQGHRRKREWKMGEDIKGKWNTTCTPVSYTHLDVYKRQ